MSKSDCHLLRQKFRQKILCSKQKVYQNTNSLETLSVFVFITEIL